MSFHLMWFPFHPRDFITSEHVAMMDLAARGAYITLLCHQWEEGSIPVDRYALCRILHITDHESLDPIWDQLKPCFVPQINNKRRLVNPRLDQERAHAINVTKQRSEAGRRGGIVSGQHRKARIKIY